MTRRLFLLTLATALPSAAQTLASLQDRNRVLLLFAPTDQDALYRQQLTALRHYRAQMKDRDLILLPLLLQSGPPATPNTLRSLRPSILSDQEQLVTRHRFHIAPTEFAAILLGKDGGEKLRSPQPLPPEDLFSTIDAMPMRQEELRQRSRK